jgi:threonine/homoserine/homoserine lactone efflux protein
MFPPLILAILFIVFSLLLLITGMITVITSRKLKGDKVKHIKNTSTFINIIGGVICGFFAGYIFITRGDEELNKIVVFSSILTVSLLLIISGSIVHGVTPKDDSSESKLVRRVAKWGNIIPGVAASILICAIFALKMAKK